MTRAGEAGKSAIRGTPSHPLLSIGRVAVLLAAASCAAAAATTLEELVESTRALHESARAVERELDTLERAARGEAVTLDEDRAALRLAEQRAAELEQQAADLAFEIAALSEGLSQTSEPESELVLLMARMIDALEQFVALDLPFRATERQQAVVELRAILASARPSLAEKLTHVFDAYLREAEYGRELGHYRGHLVSAGRDRVVDFLYVGRLAFCYCTLDGREAGCWDAARASWQALDSRDTERVRIALRSLGARAPPALLELPIPAGDRR